MQLQLEIHDAAEEPIPHDIDGKIFAWVKGANHACNPVAVYVKGEYFSFEHNSGSKYRLSMIRYWTVIPALSVPSAAPQTTTVR